MADHAHAHAPDGGEHKPHVGARGYLIVFVALLVLTGTTFLVSFLHLGKWEIPVAMAIALAKAVLVVLFFMHLIEQRFANKLVVAVSCVFVLLLVGLMVGDIITRRTYPEGIEPQVLFREEPPPRPSH